MRTAIDDLGPRHLFVIPAGDDSFPLAKGITAIALRRILEDVHLA